MKNLFIHIFKPDMIPVGYEFYALENLDLLEDASVDNILIQDLLDYDSDDHADKNLVRIYKKLNTNGKLHIQSIDIKQLSIAIAFDDIEINLAKQILYPYKKSIHTMNEITKMLVQNSFVIETKNFINIFEYYILCTKND